MNVRARDGALPDLATAEPGACLAAQLRSLQLEPLTEVAHVRSRRAPMVAIAGLAAAIGAASALVLTSGRHVTDSAAQVPVVAVRDTQAQSSATIFSASGHVVPRTVVRVAPDVPGRVAKVYARRGDQVSAGQLLVELDHGEVDANLQAAQSRIRAAVSTLGSRQAELVNARRRAEQERGFVARNASTEARARELTEQAELLERAVEAASASLSERQAERALLRLRSEKTRISAPIAGRVMTDPPAVGELFGSSNGPTHLEIIDFSSLVLESEIPESYLARVAVGTPCEIVLDAYPDRPLQGRVSEIEARVDRAKATVPVRVSFSGHDAGGVLPNMSARVELRPETREETRR